MPELAVEMGQVGVTGFPCDTGDRPAGFDQEPARIVYPDARQILENRVAGLAPEMTAHGIGVHADFTGDGV